MASTSSFLEENGAPLPPANGRTFNDSFKGRDEVLNNNFIFCVFDKQLNLYKVASSKSVGGLSASVETLTQKRGNKSYTDKLPGNSAFGSINISNSTGSSNFIYDWFLRGQRRIYQYYAHAAIIILDSTATEVVRFAVIKDAWVNSFSNNDLAVGPGTNLLDTFSLNHSGWVYADFPVANDGGQDIDATSDKLVIQTLGRNWEEKSDKGEVDIDKNGEKVYTKSNLFAYGNIDLLGVRTKATPFLFLFD